MNLAIDVLHGVVNYFMRETHPAFIRLQGIGEDRGASLHACGLRLAAPSSSVVYDFTRTRLLHLSAALQDSHDGSLVFSASAGDLSARLCSVHVAGLAADESFVRFDFAGEQARSALVQGEADAVIHEPSGLLRDAEIAG